jgi:hypothetical protein
MRAPNRLTQPRLSDDTACADADNRLVTLTPDNPPAEVAALEAALANEREARQQAEARAASARGAGRLLQTADCQAAPRAVRASLDTHRGNACIPLALRRSRSAVRR